MTSDVKVNSDKLSDSAKPKHPKINLYPEQVEHKKALLEILAKSPFALDLSMLGTGKTYTTCSIYQQGEFENIITIVPVSVKAKWKQMEKEYGIDIYKSISFCELRSVRFKQPKHGLLVRKDYTTTVESRDGTKREIEKCGFTCTSTYLKLIDQGLLLVIDEMQNLKNVSDQFYACQELIRPIIRDFKKGGKSRVIFLSGSPIDKKNQVIHLYRCLNIMLEERLSVYNPYEGVMMWRGMEEIEKYMKANFGSTEVKAVRATFNYLSDKDLQEYCYRLFQMIVKPKLSHSMPPKPIEAKIHKFNAFYQMTEENLKLLYKGVGLLKSATHYYHEEGAIDFGHDGMASLRAIQRALTIIETAKIPLFIRIAREKLDYNPGMKVVICVNYTATIEDLMDALSDHNPLRLDGRTTANKRLDLLTKFQSPDNQYRLLIGNLGVCSTGIDLDDQDGNHPRFCLTNPNYSTITLYQLSHRFIRANTKSDATIHFVFGPKDNLELPILNALAKKGCVMKETTELQVQHGVVFPGDYEPWYEAGEEATVIS